jgi:FkbM family methyltransferase
MDPATKRVFFQIGTNNGKDLFNVNCLKEKPDIIILVEPNINLYNQIKKNYEVIQQHSKVYIYMNAIYYESNKTVELVIPSKNGIYGQKADNGLVYEDLHFSLFPMNDWGAKEDMIKLQATTITFDDICKNHNIKNIEYLQIDTEGFDTEIIKMIDLSSINIDVIRFEKWGFKSEAFTEYNSEKASELGENGINSAIHKLLNYNYIIKDINDMDGNDIIAIKQGKYNI